MRNFRKIILLLVILLLTEALLGFMLEPVTYTWYLKKDLKELKRQGRQPDIVLIGDSRIYRSFVPEIFDESFGDGSHCTINAGTGSQSIQGSYYYLKDLLERYPVKYVIAELTYTCFMGDAEDSAQAEMVIWDRLSTLRGKIEYIRRGLPVSDWPYLLKSYRYRGRVDQIPETVGKKLSGAYRLGVDDREGEHYEDRGFVWTDSGYSDGATGFFDVNPVQWEKEKLNPAAFAWLDEIKKLCEEHGCELVFVTGPTTLATVYSVKDYEDSYRTFQNYTRMLGLPYFELNLLKDRRRLLPDRMMRDSDHVSGEGAYAVSRVFCDILNAHFAGRDTSQLFYASVDAMKRGIKEVIACDLRTEEIEGSRDRMIVAGSLGEPGRAVEYEFLISRDAEGRRWEVLKPYSAQNRFILPAAELERDIRLRVNARLAGSQKEYEAYNIRTRRKES